MTTLGAASVFLFRKRNSMAIQRAFLGFAAGVMIAASVWSLLIPAIERAEEAGQVGWIPAAGGFVIGVAFLMVLHQLLPHLHPGESKPEGLPSKWERPTLLFTAVTLHNIPEGMSVGLLFAMAAQNGGDPGMFGMAVALAIGIGIQNIPEGAAVALPTAARGHERADRRSGWGRCRAWPSRCSASWRGAVRGPYLAVHAVDAGILGRRHDVRGGGGADPRGAPGRAFERGYAGRHGGVFGHDGAGRGAGMTEWWACGRLRCTRACAPSSEGRGTAGAKYISYRVMDKNTP